MRPLTILLTCALLISCDQKQTGDSVQSDTLSASQSNQITLRILQPPVNNWIRNADGSTSGFNRLGEEVSVLDSNYHQQNISINYAPSSNTINLTFNREAVQVDLRHRAFNQINLLFLRGDSVNITYDSTGLPQVDVINRETKPWDLAFDQHIISSQYQYKPAARAEFFYSFSLSRKNLDAKDSARLVDQIQRDIKFENNLLDSLLQANVLSTEYHAFYKKRNMFRSETFNMIASKNYQRPDWVKKDQNLPHQYYSDFMFNYLRNTVEKQVPLLRSPNSVYRDYRMTFDDIAASDEFTTNEKDIILYNYLVNIIADFPKSDIEKYVQRFTELANNKNLPASIKQEHNLDFNTSTALVLKNSSSVKSQFAEVLAENKGKVVYVDFWASWCAPCVAALPASEELRAQYKNQPVSFIFLSIDEKFDPWIKANTRHGLASEKSFVVDNFHSSNMIEQLVVTSIPRYLLYDQQGKLIHKNAPGPGGEEITKLIDGLLNKK